MLQQGREGRRKKGTGLVHRRRLGKPGDRVGDIGNARVSALGSPEDPARSELVRLLVKASAYRLPLKTPAPIQSRSQGNLEMSLHRHAPEAGGPSAIPDDSQVIADDTSPARRGELGQEAEAESTAYGLSNLSGRWPRDGSDSSGQQERGATEKAMLPERSTSPGDASVPNDAGPPVKGDLVRPPRILPFGRGIVRNRDFVPRGEVRD